MRYLLAGLLLLCASAAQAQQMRGSVEAKDCSPNLWQSVAPATGLVTCGAPAGVDTTAAYTWTGTHTFGTVVGAVNTQTGTTYTLAASDCGKTIRATNVSAVTITTLNSLPVGCSIAVLQTGTGQVTITSGSGATLVSRNAYTKTSGQWALIGLFVESNAGGSAAQYVLTGDGI